MWIDDKVTKKCKRWNHPYHAHELTFSTYHNHHYLRESTICDLLVESIQKAREHYNFALFAYVFMPNHVHLLIYPRKEDYSTSKILGAIKRPVARKAIDWIRKNCPQKLGTLETSEKGRKYCFWQRGGGYDRNINNVDVLFNSVNYIHKNPVRKGLVETDCQWYYSSTANWKHLGEGPLKIDKEDWPC